MSLESMCLTWRHDFPLLPKDEQDRIRDMLAQLYYHHVKPLEAKLARLDHIVCWNECDEKRAMELDISYVNYVADEYQQRIAELEAENKRMRAEASKALVSPSDVGAVMVGGEADRATAPLYAALRRIANGRLEETTHMWTSESAAEFIRTIRQPLLDAGWLTYLGGSVMYRGDSSNDLDLILVPREEATLNVQDAVGVLRNTPGVEVQHVICYQGRQLVEGHHLGRRLEIAIVSRVE